MTDHLYTIVVFGACNSGKSSIINAVTKTNKCQISTDGEPTTLKLECIHDGDMTYIDTPGLPKSPSTRSETLFDKNCPPSLFWLVVNYQSAIEDDEFHIINANPNIPAIIILNKVDLLKHEHDTENFDEANYQTHSSSLKAKHKRLMNIKESNSNIKHVVVTSMCDEKTDRISPIGIPLLNKMTNIELGKTHNNVNLSTSVSENQNDRSDLTIVVSGYSCSGKSSLINAVLRSNDAANVGSDSTLTTKNWNCYKVGSLTLWDSPAVNKRSKEQQDSVSVNKSIQPDIIWFIWNESSSDIKDEHDILSFFGFDKNVPVITVINKVDKLRKIPDLCENDIIQFSHQLLECSLAKKKTISDLRDRILSKWTPLMNLKAVTLSSLSIDDDNDAPVTPIGIEALLHITSEHLTDDTQKHALDELRKSHIQYTTSATQNDTMDESTENHAEDTTSDTQNDAMDESTENHAEDTTSDTQNDAMDESTENHAEDMTSDTQNKNDKMAEKEYFLKQIINRLQNFFSQIIGLFRNQSQ